MKLFAGTTGLDGHVIVTRDGVPLKDCMWVDEEKGRAQIVHRGEPPYLLVYGQMEVRLNPAAPPEIKAIYDRLKAEGVV